MVMHAAEQAGTYIPHFCYHKKFPSLPTAGCAWWRWESAKPLPACARP